MVADEGGVGLNGRFGQNTEITNVWIEHANVGVWVGRDYSNIPDLWGPADGLVFEGMRIRNTYADGINFSNGTRNSTVFNSSLRTTGDDAVIASGLNFPDALSAAPAAVSRIGYWSAT